MTYYSDQNKFDVVIVGGGIIGCSIAYFLARTSEGKCKVAVMERKAVGEESSGGAAGMLAAQVETDQDSDLFDFCLLSRKLYPQFVSDLEQETGKTLDFVQDGIVALTQDASEIQVLKKKAQWQRERGQNAEIWQQDQIVQMLPFFSQVFKSGFFVPEDGQVSAKKLTEALAVAAKQRGVTFFECENVSPTDVSQYEAQHTVFASGAWTGKLLGTSAPVFPVKGQILNFEIPEAWRKKQTWTLPVYIGKTPDDFQIPCYLVPKKDGRLLLGATVEQDNFDREENKSASESMFAYAQHIFPDIKQFPKKNVWVGLRPGTKNHQPILGQVVGRKNVWVASGHYRNGILLAPATGKYMADSILNETLSQPLLPFAPQ